MPAKDIHYERLGAERPKGKPCDLGAYQVAEPAQAEDYYKRLGLPLNPAFVPSIKMTTSQPAPARK
jgi:hypothetical protein